jgi:DUF4097 and DUF4098 domain-containing protein YvlB
MTSFPSTGQIAASIDVQWGDIHVSAADTGATVVGVTPTDPANEKDCRAAEGTSVTCADGRLNVVGPKNRTGIINKRFGSVQVSVVLSPGSELDASSGLGVVSVQGALAGCRITTAAGDIRVEDATSAHLKTGMGVVVARDIAGEAYCSTGTGAVRIDRIGGPAEVKNSNGDTQIGESGGPLRVKSANGNVSIDVARADVHATTANGDLRVGSAESGSVQLKTSMGRIEVGIPTGTSALLDLSTSFGTVRNELDATSGPAAGERTVEVHAQTSAGDIDIVRVEIAET